MLIQLSMSLTWGVSDILYRADGSFLLCKLVISKMTYENNVTIRQRRGTVKKMKYKVFT